MLKFHVGDKVRKARKKGTFEKGFTPNWTEEVFTISSVKATKSPTYTIKDTLGESVQGTFYKQELQLSMHGIFRIERVLSKKKNQLFVKYAWRPAENNPLLPQNLRIGMSECGKTTVIFNLLLQPGWLDYNHLYVYGKSLHQQEYKVLRKGLEAGLSKQQIYNVFNSQEALGNISPLRVIEKLNGVRNGKIRADIYNDCQNIPDPSALNPMQMN